MKPSSGAIGLMALLVLATGVVSGKTQEPVSGVRFTNTGGSPPGGS